MGRSSCLDSEYELPTNRGDGDMLNGSLKKPFQEPNGRQRCSFASMPGNDASLGACDCSSCFYIPPRASLRRSHERILASHACNDLAINRPESLDKRRRKNFDD